MSCHYGYTHRSKLEAAVCQIIMFREKAGELVHVGHEKQVYLTDAKILYIADFECKNNLTGLPLFVESKGFASDRWPTIKKLWKFYGPAPLEIWTGSWQRPGLSEIIVPREVL